MTGEINQSYDGPMSFSAQNLPKGLKLDPATGRITGALAMKGEHSVLFSAPAPTL